MELEASLDWLSLSMTPGLGSRLTGKLLRQFGSPQEIFRASLTELEACRLPAAPAQAIQSRAARTRMRKRNSREVRKLGCRLLNWDEPEYPQRLLEIYDPPPLLYVRGDASVLNRHSISMVGTRRPTPYGNQVAERLGRDLAERGLAIVSGMARGIDSSAHQGACRASHGATVGVLGTGVDVIYPKENKKLFARSGKARRADQRISAGHASRAGKFSGAQPRRRGDVAGHRGGAGRAVFRFADHRAAGDGVWPGSVRRPGKHHGGRQLCAEPDDQAGRQAGDVLGRRGRGVADGDPRRAVSGRGDHQRTSAHPCLRARFLRVEKKIFGLLGMDESIHVDELVEKSELNSSEVLAALCEMEMKGMVRQMPGKQFIKFLL